MRRSYNSVHKQLKENESPAPCLVEDVRAQTQDGHIKAMKLSEVATAEEVEDNDYHDANIKADGSLKILKGSVANVSLPRTPEELRRRIKLLGVALEFGRLQFLDKAVLEKLSNMDWLEHLEWLLGEDVYGVTVKSSDGVHSIPRLGHRSWRSSTRFASVQFTCRTTLAALWC